MLAQALKEGTEEKPGTIEEETGEEKPGPRELPGRANNVGNPSQSMQGLAVQCKVGSARIGFVQGWKFRASDRVLRI